MVRLGSYITSCLLALYTATTGHAAPSPLPLELAAAAAPCDDIQAITDDYGQLEGTLQGALIILPISGTQAGTTARQLLSLLDEATLNIVALFDAIPACKPPLRLRTVHVSKRQNTVVCTALAKVTADVAKVVSLMATLSAARDRPARLDIQALQEATDDAKARMVVVQRALKDSDGCA